MIKKIRKISIYTAIRYFFEIIVFTIIFYRVNIWLQIIYTLIAGLILEFILRKIQKSILKRKIIKRYANK